MRTEVTTTTITCDLCGKPTTDPWENVSEGAPVGVISIVHEVWYGGRFRMQDFCKPCVSELAAFLDARKAIGRGQKTS